MIQILAALRIALRALRVNLLRSALTMLGIVIGVAATMVMTAATPMTMPNIVSADRSRFTRRARKAMRRAARTWIMPPPCRRRSRARRGRR